MSGEQPTIQESANPSMVSPGDIAAAIFDQVKQQFERDFVGLKGNLGEALSHVAALEAELLETRVRGTTPRLPKVSPPPKFDRKPPKDLADHFVHQISNAAKFETFLSDEQKIIWAESFLTGQALSWSATITAFGKPADNPACYDWTVWLRSFRETFCTWDAAADALRKLAALSQGSKSITQYCTEFKELSVRLSAADQCGKFVKERFWAGLNVAAKQALVTSDFKTINEAQDLLLCRESRLADIESAVQLSKPRGIQAQLGGAASGAKASANFQKAGGGQTSSTPSAQASNPPASKDPNAMEVDAARRSNGYQRRSCFECGVVGHIALNCPKRVEQLKVAVVKALQEVKLSLGAEASPAAAAPEPGFV